MAENEDRKSGEEITPEEEKEEKQVEKKEEPTSLGEKKTEEKAEEPKTPAEEKIEEKVEEPPPPVEEKVKEPKPIVEEKVEVPPPPVEEKVKEPKPIVEEKVEVPPPPVEEKVKESKPTVEEKVEVPPPPVEEKVKESKPTVEEKVEVPPPPVEEKVEEQQPPVKEKEAEKVEVPPPAEVKTEEQEPPAKVEPKKEEITKEQPKKPEEKVKDVAEKKVEDKAEKVEEEKKPKKEEKKEEKPKKPKKAKPPKEEGEDPFQKISPHVFGKYDLREVEVQDPGLKRYINLTPVGIPHTGAKHANRWFGKMKVNIVERLINNMMRTKHTTGKKAFSYRTVRNAFDIIAKRTKKNPVQVLVLALENSSPKEEITRLRFGGISVPKAVDTSSARKLDIALRNICKGAVGASHRNKKRMEMCLAEELILASKADMNSFAVSKKEELERIAHSAR